MRSRKVDFRVPWRWYEWLERRAALMRPRPYDNVGCYFIGLSFHDAMVQRSHFLTVDLANAKPNEQDRIIEELRRIPSEDPMSGSWLEHRMEEAIQEIAKLRGLAIPIEEVRTVLARVVRDYLANKK